MLEWAGLAAVAAALYVVECLAWIDAAAVVAFPRVADALGRRRWCCRQGSSLPGNDRGGILFVDPSNMRGAVVVCHRWPFGISPDGISTSTQFVRFQDIETVRAESGDVDVNGRRFAHAASPALAAHLAELIDQLLRTPLDARSGAIEAAIGRTLDEKDAAAVWASFQRRTARLSRWARALFVL